MPKNKHFLILNNGNSAHTHKHKKTQTRKKENTKNNCQVRLYISSLETKSSLQLEYVQKHRGTWHVFAMPTWTFAQLVEVVSYPAVVACTEFPALTNPLAHKVEKGEKTWGRDHHEIESSEPPFHACIMSVFDCIVLVQKADASGIWITSKH